MLRFFVLLVALLPGSLSFHSPLFTRRSLFSSRLYDAINDIAKKPKSESPSETSEFAKLPFKGCNIRQPDPEKMTSYEVTIDGKVRRSEDRRKELTVSALTSVQDEASDAPLT